MLSSSSIASHSPRGECGLKFPTTKTIWWKAYCHSPRGECGLKYRSFCFTSSFLLRHSPRGECGLKLTTFDWKEYLNWSLPARGVRIEILLNIMEAAPDRVTPREGSVDWNKCTLCSRKTRVWRHSPWGECGLKFWKQGLCADHWRHSSRGECGLKLLWK